VHEWKQNLLIADLRLIIPELSDYCNKRAMKTLKKKIMPVFPLARQSLFNPLILLNLNYLQEISPQFRQEMEWMK
jgi:hypothetical protein